MSRPNYPSDYVVFTPTQATTKVFPLASGQTPPANFFLRTFDDSSWQFSVNPTVTGFPSGGWGEPISPWVTPPTANHYFLVRILIPAHADKYKYFVHRAFRKTTFGSIPDGTRRTWVNDTLLPFQKEWISTLQSNLFLPGQPNLFAFIIGINNGNNWPTNEAWMAFRHIMYSPSSDGGNAYAWGFPASADNTSGVLGVGAPNLATGHPVPTPLSFGILAPPMQTDEKIVKIVSNGSSTIALSNYGDTYGCGSNVNSMAKLTHGSSDTATHQTFARCRLGPLGDGALFNHGIVDISLGNDVGLALYRDGMVRAWGTNSRGGVGNGLLTPMLNTFSNATMALDEDPNNSLPITNGLIKAGFNHSVMGRQGISAFPGALFVCGDNSKGQLTIFPATTTPTTSWNSIPTPQLAALVDFDAGDEQTLITIPDNSTPGFYYVYGSGKAIDGSIGIAAYNSSPNSTGYREVSSPQLIEFTGMIPPKQAGVVSFVPFSGFIRSYGNGNPWGGTGDDEVGNHHYGIPGQPASGLVRSDNTTGTLFSGVDIKLAESGGRNPGYSLTPIITANSGENPATTVRCMSLGNVGAGGSPPLGWQNPGFDDSASPWRFPGNISGGAVWPTPGAPLGVTEAAIFRQHFIPPFGHYVSGTLHFHSNDVTDAIYINGIFHPGTTLPETPRSVSTIVPLNISLLIPGSDNLIAVKAHNNLQAAAPFDAFSSWFITLNFSVDGSRAVFAATSEGLVYTWGYKGYGQMGNGSIAHEAQLFATSENGLINIAYVHVADRVMFAVEAPAIVPPVGGQRAYVIMVG